MVQGIINSLLPSVFAILQSMIIEGCHHTSNIVKLHNGTLSAVQFWKQRNIKTTRNYESFVFKPARRGQVEAKTNSFIMLSF